MVGAFVALLLTAVPGPDLGLRAPDLDLRPHLTPKVSLFDDPSFEPRRERRELTGMVMLSTVVFVILWDVYLARTGGPTESQIIANVAEEASIVPFATGAVAGHWFSSAGYSRKSRYGELLLSGMAIGIGVWDISVHARGGITRLSPLERYSRHPLFMLSVGVASGALLWSQRSQH